jgi:hypothetical protein
MAETPTSLSLDARLHAAGPAAETFSRLWDKLWRQGPVSAELLELCRLTFARLHEDAWEAQATHPAAAALAPDRRAAVLAGRLDQAAFDAIERAALNFAEYYWLDAQSIPDDAADEVKRHLGEAGLVFLIEALGCIDGRIRTARCLRDLSTARETAHA